MGATESTSRSNGTSEDEEPQEENNSSGGTSTGAVIARAVTGAAVAWGGLKMLSDNTTSTGAVIATVAAGATVDWGVLKMLSVIAIAVAGAAVAWGVLKMLSENTTSIAAVIATVATGAAVASAVLKMLSDNTGTQKSMWSRPPRGRYKMNTDGGCSRKYRDHGPGYYEGILRDHHDVWVQGFRGFMIETDTLASELYGILKGLEILDEPKLKQAIVETDGQAAFQFVTGQDEYRRKSGVVNASWSIIKDCQALLVKNNITIKHVPREYAKQCADRLAKTAKVKKQEYEDIKFLPNELKELVERDGKFST